jgi:pumilio RNA-binding family
VKGRVWQLSRDAKGCREVQRALEGASNDDERTEIARELKGRVWEALHCPHANHVVQKCITSMRPQCSLFIVQELLGGDIVRVAQHKYGCRILQRVLEHMTADDATQKPVQDMCRVLLADVPGASCHPYGNYVMQHLLEHGGADARRHIVRELCRDVQHQGANSYGAAVIAAALVHGSREGQLTLAGAVAQAPGLLEFMSCTRHGHVVVKRTVWVLQGAERERALRRLAADVQAIAACRYGKALVMSLDILPTGVFACFDDSL